MLKMEENHIFMVSSDRCGYCVKAKDFLKSKNIPLTEFNVDKLSEQEKFEFGNCIYGTMEQRFVPFIFFQKEPLGSYGEIVEAERRGMLNSLKGKTPDVL